jgi:hypothetical protein
MRGILSNMRTNRTDNKVPAIGDLVRLVNRSMKMPTYLVDTLYYTINTTEQLTFIPVVGDNSPYSGLTITHLTDANYALLLNTMLTFTGYRIVPETSSVSKITVPQYNETIILRNESGTLTAASTYSDAGGGFATTTPSETYTVLNGTGKYAYAKHITIVFDNDTGRRTVLVYAYNPV